MIMRNTIDRTRWRKIKCLGQTKVQKQEARINQGLHDQEELFRNDFDYE